MNNRKILIIYTGGTIGMKQDPDTLLLKPFDFSQITSEVPELRKFGCVIDSLSFDPIIDSSDVSVDFWVELVDIIRKKYDSYDGFVVLHGTDTMAFSASALSFMLEDLEKPVIFTGSQLPIGALRTDGKENLISSIEIASAQDQDGHPLISEVCVYFENKLYRGNRTTKYSAENFHAFVSPNYPALADVGIHIKYRDGLINRRAEWGRPLKCHTQLDTAVATIRIFPGMASDAVKAVLSISGLRAVVLETYGSGNVPAKEWFLSEIRKFVAAGGIAVNVTQCCAGSVDMGAYANGAVLRDVGVIGGKDITTEAALTKLFVLLGSTKDNSEVKELFEMAKSGEFS